MKHIIIYYFEQCQRESRLLQYASVLLVHHLGLRKSNLKKHVKAFSNEIHRNRIEL